MAKISITDSTPIYKVVLGDAYEQLPEPMKQLHAVDNQTRQIWQGVASVKCGKHWSAKFLAAVLGLPKPAKQAMLSVNLSRSGDYETWHRTFDGKSFISKQWTGGKYLYEKLGLVTIRFLICANRNRLTLIQDRISVFGICLPRRLSPQIQASETVEAGSEVNKNSQLKFNVRVDLPLFGLLVSYQGWVKKNESDHDEV